MAKSIETQNTEHRTQNTEFSTRAKVPILALIIGWLAMLVFTFHACTHMVAAGDTWVAMACGRHFVEHGVNTVEPFSANSHHPGPTQAEVNTWPGWAQWITKVVGLETVKKWHPTGWIDQNWLTHVIFYELVPKSSYANGLDFTSEALVYWKFAIYIITVICVYYTSRLLGVHPSLAAVFSCFAMFIGRSFLDIRPAGFSNMLVAVFILILALATYRNILFIWLLVPVSVFWCNVHGGYIYVFIMLVPFIGFHILLTVFQPLMLNSRNNICSIGWKGIKHVIAAYIVAFIAVIVFNPFHLTNLTHTFEISISRHAARWRQIHEWMPAFDWANPVGTAVPFLFMFIVGLAALFVWIFVLYKSLNTLKQNRKTRTKSFEELGQHKIDLALIIIAVLTTYMAIRSRRFIPIAGIAACPVIAMLINEIARWISAITNFHRQNGFVVSAIPKQLMSYFTLAGAVAVLFFGTEWGLKFKRIYLDPWPNDAKYQSVFMRMTASDAKPFYAMKFINDNKLSGKMFNYWTEGGFVAWGQTPDPNTGKTALQLFMDGRAQAAYNRDTFDEWSTIMAGGNITYTLMSAKGNDLTTDDYKKIGDSMDKQLTDRNVWLVLMPSAVFNDPDRPPQYHAIKGLETNPNWPIVFFDDEQRIYVNIKSPNGKKLFEQITAGKVIYPDNYHANLNKAHHWFYYIPVAGHEKQALDFAIKAFNESPSRASLWETIVIAMTSQEFSAAVEQLCRDYLQQYEKNKTEWFNNDGYRRKVEAVHLACVHLEQLAQSRSPVDTKFLKYCTDIRNECIDELIQMSNEFKW